ncbi:MAG TPA: hypothetical protein VFO76_07415 [Candidatus Kapabacteria bacterium]|nr:hypothetical protein [Candidatus Kapabacteria bacterium]
MSPQGAIAYSFGLDISSKAMKFIPIAVILILLTGAFTSSCRHYPSAPNDSTKCDTCCDTCHTDTTHHPCDTCNKVSDTTSHNFEWTEYTIPSRSTLSGVAVFSDNLIYAFLDKLFVFNGATWTETKVTINGKNYLPLFTDSYVFGMSNEEYWSVSGNIIYHGKKYSVDEFRLDQIGIMNYPIDGGVRSCWGPSSNDMFFVGDTGTIFHYDGANWTKFPKPTTKDLRSVWGTSHNDVWACGYNTSKGQTILLHYDGNSWTEENISITNNTITGGFDGVWACDSAGHKFVATSGALLIRKTDNGNWRSDSGLVPNRLGDGSFIGIGPVGNSPNDMMAIGGWGFIAHWNGKDWKRYDQLYNYGSAIYYTAAFSIKGNIACAVGSKDGQSWIAIGRRKQ